MKAMTIREAINAGCYYHVRIPQWASGGLDVAAERPEDAALLAGCMMERLGMVWPMQTDVRKHLSGSRIGCSYLEEAGSFPMMTADHYSI